MSIDHSGIYRSALLYARSRCSRPDHPMTVGIYLYLSSPIGHSRLTGWKCLWDGNCCSSKTCLFPPCSNRKSEYRGNNRVLSPCFRPYLITLAFLYFFIAASLPREMIKFRASSAPVRNVSKCSCSSGVNFFSTYAATSPSVGLEIPSRSR